MEVPTNACCVGGPAVNQPPITAADMLFLAVMSVAGVLIVLVSAMSTWM
ncbi:MAG TPA: hypothetical protein VMU01_05235 [Rhizomicrobium sp.]|nr:hypothetical protein [Rhizomicrobium sp.]